MDFFSAVVDPTQPILRNDRQPDDAPDSFAEAIASRFGSTALLTTRLTPLPLAPPTIRLPNSPMASMSIAPPPAARPPPPSVSIPQSSSSIPPTHFTAVTTHSIQQWIDDQAALILDIRPHAAHSAARVPRAVSLSVPSTLLKRPLFSLHRLADMLPSANARARFSTWRSASRILVYDADSPAIPESSNIYGLLRKFKNDGFQGDLAWLKGGFQAVWREKHDIIDAHPPMPDVENDDDDDDSEKSSQTQTPCNVLRTRHLPMSAFSLSSTTVSSSPSLVSTTKPKRGPLARGATFPTLPTPSQGQSQPAFNPFFDAVRQNLELSQGITERIPLRLPRRVRHRIHDLPFPWLREIARRAAKLAPRNRPAFDSSSSASEESEDEENVTSADVEEGKEMLAMQFFKVEVAEQRRLMGIMEHHSKETTIVTTQTSAASTSNFPYSITAGVEKGTKNRYRHIWPFEHARVKLHQYRDADDDYVNASYIQPLGSNKRYIATQGPLPTTFTDFWTLCWEQDVHVIAMLTREVENSMVKCGTYWTDATYGPLRLNLVSTSDIAPATDEHNLFGSHPMPLKHSTTPAWARQHSPSKHLLRRHPYHKEIIRRVFELTHTHYPDAKPRRIIHLQYLDWPDMNVPDDPRGLLALVREVNDAARETGGLDDLGSGTYNSHSEGAPIGASGVEIDAKTGIVRYATGKNRPVLLHCSAGVGRTGGFIAVDAILDSIQREMRDRKNKQDRKGDENAMDVDDIAPILTPAVVSFKGPMIIEQRTQTETSPVTTTPRSKQTGTQNEFVSRTPFPMIAIPTPTPKLRMPTQVDSEGTEPEASESDREISSCERSMTMAPVFTGQWRGLVGNEPYAPDTAVRLPAPDQQHQTGTADLGFKVSLQDTVPFPTCETFKSGLSQSHLAGRGRNGFGDLSSSNYLLQSSSPTPSVSGGVVSPKPSFALPLPSANHVQLCTLALPLADPVPSRPLSEPIDISKAVADSSSNRALSLQPSGFGDDSLSKQSTPWLGESIGRRSPSPMAQSASAPNIDITIQPTKPPNKLYTSPYPGATSTSSEAESPSGSLSPSADEGSVASQVSSYHTHLKKHHYQPLHAKSLPINLDRAAKVKGIHSSHATAPILGRPSSPALSQSASTQAHLSETSIANYKEPRPLHELSNPPNLTCFEDPIYEIVQDMREQRMSLCQSLRQYVFVHAAVVEGALMIVDEEEVREKERERGGSMVAGTNRQEEDKNAGVTREVECGGGENVRQVDQNPNVGMLPGQGTSWGSCEPIILTDEMSESASVQGTRSGSGKPKSESEGQSVSSLPTIKGHDGEKDVMEADVFSVHKTGLGQPFASALSSRSHRHSRFGARFGKGSTSAAESLFVDDNSSLLRKPSAKRKQPSGEGEDSARNKRPQNESPSRERKRERERERERRISNNSYTREVGVEGLVPGSAW